ncbi:MAG: hypothetical protein JWM89_615 [Acidimicrobiales bacterium]|nr:hypothetical protein [Acidimicrobiales bacterium]
MVRRHLPSLSTQQVTRLPPRLRDAHDDWEHDARQEPSAEQRRTRARRLALSLLELGETEEATEMQLHRWRIHPALAHEAMRWAQQRRGERPIPRSARVPVLATAAADGGPPRPGPLPERPRIGASRPAPGAQFDPYDPPGDAA